MTNAGGPAIACADACGAAGLRVEPLQDATRKALLKQLPPAASAANPVDMLAAATSSDFRRAIETVAADPGVDAIIAIFIQALPGRGVAAVLRAIRTAAQRARRAGVPVAAVVMAPGAPARPRPAGRRARLQHP